MKVTFAVPGDLATPSGGYGYARRLMRGGAAAGIDFEHLALPGGFPHPTAEDIAEVIRLGRKLPPDRVVLVDGLALGAMTGDQVRAAFAGPVVALCHHPLSMEAGLDPGRAAELAATERAALSVAAAVITTSQATAGILCDRFGVVPGKVSVACPGTDPAPRATGPGGPGCAIVSVGSVTQRKGHRRLIAALADMADTDWTLRIVGPCPDPDERAAVEALIADQGLQDRVALTGSVSMTGVQAALQTSDLFVLASEYEGFGMAFAEAMANGLPVLGLQCAAVAEATLGAARLVSPTGFAAALDDLVRRPASRVALAEECWRAAARLPRWRDTIATVADVLRAQSGFSADWLDLRRDADDRARSAALTRALGKAVAARGRTDVRVVDLGSGTGANLRALAPHLPGRQSWVLADNDPALLARVEAPTGVEVETRLAAIPGDLAALFDPAPDLVTASAFFDLCGRAVADQIVQRTIAANAIFHTVLTFDGQEEWGVDPTLDPLILEQFLQDQQRDKGMGPALGPGATGYLAAVFRKAGYIVKVRPSDWRLAAPQDTPLIVALAEGHAETARPVIGARADQWLEKAHQAGAVRVGHQDLLAIPPD